MHHTAPPPCACNHSYEPQLGCPFGRTHLWDEKWGTGLSRPPASQHYTNLIHPTRPMEDHNVG